MAGERRVLTLQVEALRAEALQAKIDLEDQHHLHQQDMQRFREESLKVGRKGLRICLSCDGYKFLITFF